MIPATDGESLLEDLLAEERRLVLDRFDNEAADFLVHREVAQGTLQVVDIGLEAEHAESISLSARPARIGEGQPPRRRDFETATPPTPHSCYPPLGTRSYHAQRPLEAGVVISIETTLSHPRRGFIKLEDTVAVTPDAYEAYGDEGRGWN